MRIESIGDNEHFEYKGSLQVQGSIGKNATVIIKDGSLTVGGDVGQWSDIAMQSSNAGGSVVISGVSIFIGGANLVSIGGGQVGEVTVRGNVESDAKIVTRNACITVGGNIDNNANIHTTNGSIRAADIGNGATLISSNGNIDTASVHSRATLETSNGNISATDVEEGSVLRTTNGNISVRSAHPTAAIQTINGEVYENGVPSRAERPSSSSSVVFAGGSVFMSGNVRVGVRVIVNGVDMTDIVNGRAGAQPTQQQEEQPIRYVKKGL